jgi:hypothetical protein
MDDELQQLEAELKALRPAAPSASLGARIKCDFADSAVAPTAFGPKRGAIVRRPAPLWWFCAAALPAAAAATFLLVVLSRREVPASGQIVAAAEEPGTVFKPVAAENVLYAVRDEGLVTLDDGTAARRERLHYVDTITWKNPRTNASVRWTVPREEVRVVPVKFQ